MLLLKCEVCDSKKLESIKEQEASKLDTFKQNLFSRSSFNLRILRSYCKLQI